MSTVPTDVGEYDVIAKVVQRYIDSARSGMSDEMITIFYASGLERVGPGGGDSNEDITVHLVPLKDTPRWLEAHRAEGIMLDPKIFAGLYWAGMRESSQSE